MNSVSSCLFFRNHLKTFGSTYERWRDSSIKTWKYYSSWQEGQTVFIRNKMLLHCQRSQSWKCRIPVQFQLYKTNFWHVKADRWFHLSHYSCPPTWNWSVPWGKNWDCLFGFSMLWLIICCACCLHSWFTPTTGIVGDNFLPIFRIL